jgi:hypothetical protein
VELEIPDLHAGLCRDGPDPICRGGLVRTFQDSVHVDDPAHPDCSERVCEVVECRMREVQDDAVDRGDLC